MSFAFRLEFIWQKGHLIAKTFLHGFVDISLDCICWSLVENLWWASLRYHFYTVRNGSNSPCLDFSQVNIVRYNEETIKKMHDPKFSHQELSRSLPSENDSSENKTYSMQKMEPVLPLSSGKKDLAMPMPPLWLVPLKQNITR